MHGSFVHVFDGARIVVPYFGRELDKFGQVEVPGLVEGQIGLICRGDGLAILQQVDGNLRGVEGRHQADQGVGLAKRCRAAAVHLHLGHSWRRT